MIQTRVSRVFAALEPAPALPEWLVTVQAERAAEAARVARVVAMVTSSPLRDGYGLYYPSA